MERKNKGGLHIGNNTATLGFDRWIGVLKDDNSWEMRKNVEK